MRIFERFFFVLYGSKLHLLKLNMSLEALVCLYYIYLIKERMEWEYFGCCFYFMGALRMCADGRESRWCSWA